MKFEKRHAINPKNEILRKQSGRFTLADLINNIPIDALKPVALPCSCGRDPLIEIDYNKDSCFVTCSGCDINLEFKGGYADAIFGWNKLELVVFCVESNNLSPFIDFNGNVGEFITQATKIKSNALDLKKTSIRTEIKLINLIVSWCDFSIEKVKQLSVKA